jgi:hypothetical protein
VTADQLARLTPDQVLEMHPGSMDDRSPQARRERRWLLALRQIGADVDAGVVSSPTAALLRIRAILRDLERRR